MLNLADPSSSSRPATASELASLSASALIIWAADLALHVIVVAAAAAGSGGRRAHRQLLIVGLGHQQPPPALSRRGRRRQLLPRASMQITTAILRAAVAELVAIWLATIPGFGVVYVYQVQNFCQFRAIITRYRLDRARDAKWERTPPLIYRRR